VGKSLRHFIVLASLAVAGLCSHFSQTAVAQVRPKAVLDDDSEVEELFSRDFIEQTQGVAPLAPNEPLRPSATTTQPERTDGSVLGPPTLAGLTGGRGRARLLSRGRATAPYMVGDFFGGIPGSTAQIPGPSIDNAAFIFSQSFLGGIAKNADGPPTTNGQFFGSPSGPTAPNPGTSSLVIPGLVMVNAKGQPLSAAPNQPTFLATAASSQPGGLGFPFDPRSPIYQIRPDTTLILPNASSSGAGLVGLSKISENTSPMPRDRIFFNYSGFSNVPFTANGVNVNRFTPGFEQTFFDGATSVEIRVPFASTLNNTIYVDGPTSTGNVLLGDVSVTLKGLLYTDEELAISAGLQMSVPTAGALDVRTTNGTELVKVTNDTVYLMPFLGALYTPGDRFFTQGFLQFDIPGNSNSVYVNNTFNGPVTSAGTIRDVPFVFVDIGTGYWLFRNDESRGITGFSATAELHYNQSLNGATALNSGFYQIGSTGNNFEMLNLVVGGHLNYNRNTTLTVGYAFPVGNSVDQMFTGEVRAFINYTFGRNPFRAPPSI
jgi:hypothetical protein